MCRFNQNDEKGEQFSYNLMLDQQGVLRCQGGYQNAELIHSAKCPSRREHYTRLIIEDSHHNILLHAGMSQTLVESRQNYWISKGRSEVKKYLIAVKCANKQKEESLRCQKFHPGQRKGSCSLFLLSNIDKTVARVVQQNSTALLSSNDMELVIMNIT